MGDESSIQHYHQHFRPDGLCQCACIDCTTSLGFCICLECPCDEPDFTHPDYRPPPPDAE